MIRYFSRRATSPPGKRFGCMIQSMRSLPYSSATTSGSRRQRARLPWPGPRSSSIPQLSAGFRAWMSRKKETGMMPGRRYSGATPSPTASTLPQQTGWAGKRSSNSGGAHLSATPSARLWPEPAASEEEVLIADLDLARNELVREGWGFFRNRRPDVYWPLIEMVKAEDSWEKRAKRGNRILSGGYASAAGLPHACRMGRARGDLARLAL